MNEKSTQVIVGVLIALAILSVLISNCSATWYGKM
jgi:hypothetical protein